MIDVGRRYLPGSTAYRSVQGRSVWIADGLTTPARRQVQKDDAHHQRHGRDDDGGKRADDAEERQQPDTDYDYQQQSAHRESVHVSSSIVMSWAPSQSTRRPISLKLSRTSR